MNMKLCILLAISIFAYFHNLSAVTLAETDSTIAYSAEDATPILPVIPQLAQVSSCLVEEGGIHTQMISLDDAYANEARVFARMIRTGKMHGTYEQLIQPVYYMAALYESLQTGNRVEVAQAVVD